MVEGFMCTTSSYDGWKPITHCDFESDEFSMAVLEKNGTIRFTVNKSKEALLQWYNLRVQGYRMYTSWERIMTGVIQIYDLFKGSFVLRRKMSLLRPHQKLQQGHSENVLNLKSTSKHSHQWTCVCFVHLASTSYSPYQLLERIILNNYESSMATQHSMSVSWKKGGSLSFVPPVFWNATWFCVATSQFPRKEWYIGHIYLYIFTHTYYP